MKSRVCVSSTRLFCTAMPNSAMKPTAEETLSVWPLISSEATPPMKALGTVARMIVAYPAEFSAM